MEEGVSAAVKQIWRYQSKDGLNTLRGIIYKWAPPNENRTGDYIARVAKATGLDPDAPVDLHDTSTIAAITRAMAQQETGKSLDPEIFKRGAAMAAADTGQGGGKSQGGGVMMASGGSSAAVGQTAQLNPAAARDALAPAAASSASLQQGAAAPIGQSPAGGNTTTTTQVAYNATTTVNVNGSQDPKATGQAVADNLGSVHQSNIRNLQGAAT